MEIRIKKMTNIEKSGVKRVFSRTGNILRAFCVPLFTLPHQEESQISTLTQCGVRLHYD